MRFVTVSDLKQRATQIVAEIVATGKEVVVTKNGLPVVLMRPTREDEFQLKPSAEREGRGLTPKKPKGGRHVSQHRERG